MVGILEHHKKESLQGSQNQLSLPKDAREADGPFRILAAVSGGKDSAIMLHMLFDILGKRRDVEIIAGVVDEGIDGYRSSIDCVEELCSMMDVELVRIGYEDIDTSGWTRLSRSCRPLRKKTPMQRG